MLSLAGSQVQGSGFHVNRAALLGVVFPEHHATVACYVERAGGINSTATASACGIRYAIAVELNRLVVAEREIAAYLDKYRTAEIACAIPAKLHSLVSGYFVPALRHPGYFSYIRTVFCCRRMSSSCFPS